MRPVAQMAERVPDDPEASGIRPGFPADDPQRLGLDGEVAEVERPMVQQAEDQAIPRVVGTVLALGAEMGGVEQLDDVQSAHGTARPIALQDAELEPLLSLG
jgi:hypothetical protein